jgi:hypothetical protein
MEFAWREYGECIIDPFVPTDFIFQLTQLGSFPALLKKTLNGNGLALLF